MKRGGVRAVALVRGESRRVYLDPERQQRLLFEFITEQRYTMTALTKDDEAAVALVAAGLVDVVVVAVAPHDVDELEARIIGAGGRLVGVRRDARPADAKGTELGEMIRRAVSTGLTVEAVARIFDVHPDAVELALRNPGTGRTAPVARGGVVVPMQGRRTEPVARPAQRLRGA